MLSEFDLAVGYECANSIRHDDITPDFNTGIVGCKKNDFTADFMKQWIDVHIKDGRWNDQWAFKKVYNKYKKHFCILPGHYQLRRGIINGAAKMAVLTHDHSMSRNVVLEEISKHYDVASKHYIQFQGQGFDEHSKNLK